MSEQGQGQIEGLRQALAAGFIDAATFEAAAAAIAAGTPLTDASGAKRVGGQSLPAAPLASGVRQGEVTGSGALAQGNGDALSSAVKIDGDNSGAIVIHTEIVNHYCHAAGSDPAGKRLIASQVGAYLAWLQERTQSIELRGIERAGSSPVIVLPLETAYVPLRARVLPLADHVHGRSAGRRETIGRHAGLSDSVPVGGYDSSESDLLLSEVLGYGNRVAIIGGPGSGKTTVLLHMAWALASSLLARAPEPARSRLGLTMAPNELPLPILVPLASFARYRRHLPADALARERTLAHFISYHLISREAPFDLPADFFVRLLHEGRNVLLLLDGLAK